MNKSILLALFAAFCYGIGGPTFKAALNNGATTTGIGLAYGLAVMLLSWNWAGSTVLFGSGKGFLWTSITGLLMGAGLVAFGKAAGLPNSNVSILAAIVGAYPLITAVLGMALLGEAATTNMPRALLGVTVIVIGVWLVSTSGKTP